MARTSVVGMQTDPESTPPFGGVPGIDTHTGTSPRFSPWAQCMVAPRMRGVHGKADDGGISKPSEHAYPTHLKPTPDVPPRPMPLITHAYRQRTHPALRGVLPCIKPTVKKLPTAVRQIGQTAKRVCPAGVRARGARPNQPWGQPRPPTHHGTPPNGGVDSRQSRRRPRRGAPLAAR